ncbi:hypothetical protein MMC20_001588 [Loxospora ochrophaea]|nr:hypothetical protein [Loxospora ochrophaea]
MRGWGLFFLLLFLLLIIAVVGWIVYTRWQAHRNGLPPPPLSAYIPFRRSTAPNYPAPRPGGVVGWVQDKINNIKNRRTAGGAYEEPLSSTGGRPGRRGFGPLDPDGAWDSRVGNEADAYGPGGYYEEQELGLHQPASGGAYGGSGYGGAPPTALPAYGSEEIARGRSVGREPEAYVGGGQRGLDQRYDEETGRNDPFGDGAERSDLRGVSPRPMELDAAHKGHTQKGSGGSLHGDSPTERRSMFHENM